jgi:hypothetical protein
MILDTVLANASQFIVRESRSAEGWGGATENKGTKLLGVLVMFSILTGDHFQGELLKQVKLYLLIGLHQYFSFTSANGGRLPTI